MATHDQLVGVTIFFTILTTITVGLRIIVRTRLSKGAFGWDDVFLIVTYIGYILFSAFVFETMHYGYVSTDSQTWYDKDKGVSYNNAMNDVCYFISATVKISVALVLYRLVERVYDTIRWILIIDIILCVVFNTATTLVLALGCMEGTPYTFTASVCENANYAQEASYVIWDLFHVVLPIFILWNIQMTWRVKAGVVGLFGVGLVAVIATIMRLLNYVEYFNPKPTTTMAYIWYTGVTWTTIEHGLSLFASSILALKPVVQLVSSSWSSLASTLSSSKKSGRDTPGAGGVLKPSDWTYTTAGTELGSIGVPKDVSVNTERRQEGQRLHAPLYTAEITGSHDSHSGLVEGLKARSEAGNIV